jgi:glucose/arabinose dehydrogenase
MGAMRRRWTLQVVLSSLISIGVSAVSLAQTIPAGFGDVLIVNVPAPTALAFTPDGRMLITSQPGQLFVVQSGTLLATPALDLSASMCTDSERGLLGVAVDPQFPVNGYIYVFYTFRKFTSCPRNVPGTPVNRVSRFTMTGNTVNRPSELVLIDNIPSFNGNHNAGDLQFGRDGYLYIATGDGGCDYTRATGCAALNGAARYQHALVGKVLRITATGAIPSTNPFRGSNSVRCNVTGSAQPGQVCQETFVWGFRNPWRLAFDPNASGTRFFINDVGQNTWEEVDEATAGADYGWNVREGRCVTGSVTDCGPPPIGMTNPIYSYRHVTGGCKAITGGAFVPSGVWPVEYEGTYLFGDYTCGSIFKLTRSSTGTYSRTTFVSGLGASSAVSLTFGPHGATQALYYLTYANGGQVRRIAAVSGTNRSPTASAMASPRFGPLPLTVRFDASASTDPDGDTLTFDWNFGDGSAHVATPVANHTYTTAGRVSATVTVDDGHGHTSAASVTIDAGNHPPAPSITSPSATARFFVGQMITLSGSATDVEDGTIPSAGLTWEVVLHHDTHTHPWLQPTSGNNLAIQAPAPEDLAATTTSYLEIRLTATDSQGATSTSRRDMQPRLVNVTFDSVPSGLRLSANGTTITTPRTVTSWERYALTLTAPTQRDASGQPWLCASWSDGGAATHTVVTPATATAYTATFARAAASVPTADTYARGGTYAAQNFGTATTVNAKQSTSADTTRQAFLRFTLPAQQVARAVVRLNGAASSNVSDVPIAIYPVANTTWSETALTWNARPASGTSPLATAVVKGTARAWYEWDVTSYVRSQIAAGSNAVSFSLYGTAATTPFASFSSREATSSRPVLVT